MIFTARQLEQMLKSDGRVTLPYRARLTPLAQDLIRQKKIEVGYAEGDPESASLPAPTPMPAAGTSPTGSMENSATKILWWCDGPCGPAKAAVMAQSRESGISELGVAHEAGQLTTAIRRLASELKVHRDAGGILLVQFGAAAMVYANRCPSLRAVLGTCMQAVEQGSQQVAANVLVIEYPYMSLSQVKNLLIRFIRGKREVSQDLRQRLKELSSCA